MGEPVTVAALYVQRGGCYWDLPGVNPWDEERDARQYAGPHPVVAHPPCNRWAMPYAKMNETRYGHIVGDDGGCFAAALEAVRRWGGVLEHPANTAAWRSFGLPKPLHGVWLRTFDGGWVGDVAQGAYGHPARKRTWLYAHGAKLPALTKSLPASDVVIGYGDYRQNLASGKRMISKAQASETPLPFRDLLLSIARSARA